MIVVFFPNEPSDERVMVGTFVAYPREPLGFHVALVEHVVDAEPEAVGMVSDTGP